MAEKINTKNSVAGEKVNIASAKYDEKSKLVSFNLDPSVLSENQETIISDLSLNGHTYNIIFKKSD